MQMISKTSFSLCTIAAALLLSACGGKEPAAPANSAGAAPAADTSNVVYTVGSDATYAPFEYQDDKGQVIGFSQEVIQAVADKAGIKIQIVNKPWEGIFETLNTGDSDIVSSSVTITEERKAQMDFSEPYFEATQMIAINDNKGADIKSFADLKNGKHLVSVQTGTTGDIVSQKLMGADSKQIKRFESMPLALKELLAGGVDASVGDNGVVQNFVTNNPGAKLRTLVDPTFEKEYYGFAVKKGRSDDLLNKINTGLAGIKSDGTYDKIYAKWFATAAAPAASATN
ncbi:MULTISPECIES: basic amino acid ABC transporter substrate-binding protein [Vitreoscilla]|uniref:Basic amino acid ABC transporter substrate-binding protein n=1 Tax=Vitreoscilla stercoraria TaxID=61 RepID=A0ABY4E8T3_VITST|nr:MULTISPECIES: basic amino acid ABC transporter substrate-binding protein [Vitreoscilla]AUZ04620.1 periplasmic substrate-binding protein [Vitreoscilla sp. C1]UOO91684.1 basic amino acid ABC transporter substrate-binding protein [Vitreoscilla stercoraria]